MGMFLSLNGLLMAFAAPNERFSWRWNVQAKQFVPSHPDRC